MQKEGVNYRVLTHLVETVELGEWLSLSVKGREWNFAECSCLQVVGEGVQKISDL